MRVDSLSYFSASLPGIRENQTAVARLNQQIASGVRLLAPKDDPIDTEKVLYLSNRVAVRSQLLANQDQAELTLKYSQTVVQEIQKAMTTSRGLLSISISSSQELRNIHAEQLKGSFNHILGLLNTRDPSGNFIFAGFSTDTTPFANDSVANNNIAETTYNGGAPSTAGANEFRNIQIEEGRSIQVNDNLSTAFIFTDSTIADAPNTAGNGAVTDPNEHDLLENLAYEINGLPAGTMTVDEINNVARVISASLERLALVEHRIAGALSEIVDTRGTTKALLLQEKNALSDIQQVDQAAAIVELQLRQTALEAAGRAYSRTSGLSLFNFLG
jgi:flagellar hook-associated protein 3 FlgL